MSPHLTLYGAKTGNCLRAAIALEEAGLPFTTQQISLRRGEHVRTPYLKLNPLGQVPILVVEPETGPSSIITQSNAIMVYAAEEGSDKNLIGGDLMARTKVFERFFYFLTEAIAPSYVGFRLADPKHSTAVALLGQKAVSSIVFAENFLSSQSFIAGDTFSLADIAAFTIVSAYKDEVDWTALPKLHDWYGRIADRDGTRRGMGRFNSI